MDTGLKGKVAVVTGSGRIGGIGQAIAAALAGEGAKIVLSDIGRPFDDFPDYEVAERSDIERCGQALRSKGTEVEILFADVAKEQVERFVRAGVDELILVMQMGTVPHEAILESIRTFAEKVMPHFK